MGAGGVCGGVAYAGRWRKLPGRGVPGAWPRPRWRPPDLTGGGPERQTAAEIGGRVDILINTAEVHRAQGIASRKGIEVARAEMDVNYFGLLRLAQEFGPVMRSRGADGQSTATACVNLQSVYALTNFPRQ